MIALNFLDANSIQASTRTRSTAPLDAASVAEQAKPLTVHVVCH